MHVSPNAYDRLFPGYQIDDFYIQKRLLPSLASDIIVTAQVGNSPQKMHGHIRAKVWAT